MPCRWSSFLPLSFSIAFPARNSATPPPGRMPSSTAARVACIASSTRSFALFHFSLGRTADADYRDSAGELGQPFLQFLLVVVGGGLLNLRLDLSNARLYVGLFAGTIDDRAVFLV